MARYHSHDLHSLIGLDLAQVVAWFLAHGGLYGESLDADDLEVVDDDLYVGGYYADSVPVFEFEHGLAVRWYLSDCWD